MLSKPDFSSPTNERLFLLVLAGIQFTHILDFMIMMPLGPQLIRDLHLSTHEFGLLPSSYTFAAASGLLAATYVVRFNRRTLTLTLYAPFIAATLCCGLARDFAALLIARALAGTFGGILGALAQTMIADVVPFERRGHAMGAVMAAFRCRRWPACRSRRCWRTTFRRWAGARRSSSSYCCAAHSWRSATGCCRA